MKRRLGPIGVLSATIFALGCSSLGPKIHLNQPETGIDSKALASAVEQYYSAPDADAMRKAVEKAKAISPNSGAYHEIAADIASLNDNREEVFEHLLQAVRDPNSDRALVSLRSLWDMSWTFEQRNRVHRLLEAVIEQHPSEEVRALAAFQLTGMLHLVGKLDESREMAKSYGWQLPFTVIGTWDNEQGKGFDIAYPPEKEIVLDATYKGQKVEISWRKDFPLGTHRETDFSEIMHPSYWGVAYGVTAVDVLEAGNYELRLSTTDGMKVWVNDRLVFADREIDGWSFDALVIPVKLNKGANRILIKSTQERGGWDLFGRLTLPEGIAAPAGAFTALEADTSPIIKDDSTEPALNASAILAKKIEKMEPGSATAFYTAIRWASIIGLQVPRTRIAEQMLVAHPRSLRGMYSLTIALWNNQEHGRTTGLLDKLMEIAGDDFVRIKLKRVRFWRQNDLDRKARELLMELKEDHPDSADVWLALSSWFDSENWDEDSCFAIEEVNKRWPDWPKAHMMLASCYESMNLKPKAKEIYEQMVEKMPNHYSLFTILGYSIAAFDLDEAQEIIERIVKAWPERKSSWRKLAGILHMKGDFRGAEEAWKKVGEISPSDPESYRNLADIAYYEKRTDEAIKLWREKLKRDPDDGALAERLAFLEPPQSGPWAVDVPSEEDIEKAIAMAKTHKFDPAADTALLVDHAVAELKPDGSSVTITTTIQQALNLSGVDVLTESYAPCYGYSRILHAFAVSPSGDRVEGAIRNRAVRFRQLEEGSITVIQDRCENGPDSLIGDYFSTGWSYQSFNKQFVDSRYILWTPKDTKLSEHIQGEVKREERTDGDFTRIEWSAQDIPILTSEAHMPPPSEIVWRLQISTIPNWDLFLKWEQALLQNVFRESPEVVALADKLFNGLEDPNEKLLKIHEFLATEIRYQQDYENTIAGVKPHPAPVVIERGYGDCKDKSVLFITLAKLAGIEVRFALVRTRGLGQVIRDIPSQQFNHAIVYVPKQEGISQDRFFDPTADALDVEVIRSDDPGTWSLVLDTKKGKAEWKQIPFQSSDSNFGEELVKLALSDDGSATGTLGLKFKGKIAALLRQLSRNPEQFSKVIQVVVDSLISGATVEIAKQEDISSVRKSVEVEVKVKTDTFARKDDGELKFKIPFDASPQKMFSLEKRSHALILGVPSLNKWRAEIDLPKKSKVEKLPKDFKIDSKCIQYSKVVKVEGKKIVSVQTLEYLCERIEADEYPIYRNHIQKLRQAAEDNVIIKLKK